MERIELPKFIDEPPTILLWSVDELAPFIVGLVIGMQLNQALIFTIFGLLLTKVYRRYLDQNADGFVNHWLYWHGLTFSNAKTQPNPFEREFC
jgi:conjugal transfer pilus assembly protein TraL